MGSMGQYLPLAPCFAYILLGFSVGAAKSPYIFVPFICLAFVPLYYGADIIDMRFLKYNAISGHHHYTDSLGNESSFSATYLITQITDVVQNSAVLTLHRITKFATESKVSRSRVTAIGTNFDMRDIHSYFMAGNGELFGFDFKTDHIAEMGIREDPTETITDENGTMAIIYLTSYKVIDDQLKSTLDKKVEALITN